MQSRHVEIKSPCHENWDAMHGDDERRFCDVCAKHVHNLSAMTNESAADLLRVHQGEHLCVRYSQHDDGRIAFRDDPVVPIARLRGVRTAFAAVMLAACAPHGDGPPIQDLGDITIEAMARDARPSADGGCEVQTGPLTTLHFPADHAVCRHLADRGDMIKPPLEPQTVKGPPLLEPPMMGAAPVVAPVPEPAEPAVMGAMVDVQPPPTPVVEETMGKVAPRPEMKMGEAMPEVKEPCDPNHGQGFAPPPPPPSERRELMGDIAGPAPRPQTKMGAKAPSRTGGAVVDDL